MSSYLVLLRATLAVPLVSPRTRWALTPPFHPCLATRVAIGGLFSVALVSDRSAWALPSALPCGVRTFLSKHRFERPPGLLQHLRVISVISVSLP